jgi:hypothetical protein
MKTHAPLAHHPGESRREREVDPTVYLWQNLFGDRVEGRNDLVALSGRQHLISHAGDDTILYSALGPKISAWRWNEGCFTQLHLDYSGGVT